jgi:hypothetical protein
LIDINAPRRSGMTFVCPTDFGMIHGDRYDHMPYDVAIQHDSPLPAAPTTGPIWARPGRGKRLSDKILVAFHRACDQGDLDVAGELASVLDLIARRARFFPSCIDRRANESLAAAYERLWHLRHSE